MRRQHQSESQANSSQKDEAGKGILAKMVCPTRIPRVCVSCVRPRYASHVPISCERPMYALVRRTGQKFCTSFWRVLGVQNLIFFKFVHYIFGFESNI